MIFFARKFARSTITGMLSAQNLQLYRIYGRVSVISFFLFHPGLIEDKTLKFRAYDYFQYYKSLSHKRLLLPVDSTIEESFAYKVLREEQRG